MPVVENPVPAEVACPLTIPEIREALRGVEDPELALSIVELGEVVGIDRAGDSVVVHLALPLPEEGWPAEPLVGRVEEAVGAVPGVASVEVDRRPMTEAEAADVGRALKGEPARNPLAVVDASAAAGCSSRHAATRSPTRRLGSWPSHPARAASASRR